MSDRDRDGDAESTSAAQPPEGEPLAGEAGAAEIEALSAWAVPDPPAGFADRVVAARGEAVTAAEQVAPTGPMVGATPAPRTRRQAAPWIVVAVAAAAALLVVQLRGSSRGGADVAGSAAPLARQSIRLGARGVAVAEPGAVLSWQIDGGRTRVSQRSGDVFYRVERGGSFEVETPHGAVRVTGTCFRVEMRAMKTPWQGVVGAAIGAMVVVTVYEGSVLFAGGDGGERAVEAGQVMSAGEQGVQVSDGREARSPAAGAAAAAPAADATREDLLRRDSLQRAEIAALRTRMRQLEQGVALATGPGVDGRDASGRPWFDPSKEDLVRFAGECRVRSDSPPVLRSESVEWRTQRAQAAGLSDSELASVNRVLRDIQREVLAELRALHIEATGDPEHTDSLSPDAMANELIQMYLDEEQRLMKRIAQERAGLAAPPTDLSQLSPLERFLRRRAGLGDETERRIGEVLGAARARKLREGMGGWGDRTETVGCPGDEQRTEEDVIER